MKGLEGGKTESVDFLDEAFDALQADDRDGFKAAMAAYVDECMLGEDEAE